VADTKKILESQWQDIEVLEVTVDVADQVSVEKLLQRTVERFGQLDYGTYNSPDE
jgi:hypothetical protein